MEKVSLKILLLAVLVSFSCFVVFAQDGDSGQEGTGTENSESVSVPDNDTKQSANTLSSQTQTATVQSASKQATSKPTSFTIIEKFNNIAQDIILSAESIDYRILIFATVVIVLLSLIAFSIVFAIVVNKRLKKIASQIETYYEEHEKKINDAKQEMQNQYDRVDQEFRSIPSSVNIPRSYNTVQSTVSGEEFLKLKERVYSLENSREKEIRNLREKEKIANDLASGKLEIKDIFNDWASNPSLLLPKSFYFIDGDMNIRTRREIKESAIETLWISNREGLKKYLFPNPRFFDQMTDILAIYKMDQARLKGKGQNRIKVTRACEMTNEGFVEFPGELEIL